MEPQEFSERWVQVFAMTNYMLSGDFSHQIPRSSHDDTLEELIVQLNILSQHLEAVFNRISYMEPRKSYRFLSRLTFTLDKAFTIINFSEKAIPFFGLSSTALNGKNFHDLLHPCSREKWEILQESLPKSDYSQVNLKLSFQTRYQFNVAAECSVTKMAVGHNASYTISFYKASVLEEDIEIFKPNFWMKEVNIESKSADSGISPPITALETNFVIKLEDEISKNLKHSKPDLTDSAIEYGIGETRLRAIFRHVFKYTPVEYYHRERFFKILDLVAGTQMSFKEISIMYNFREYSHFSNSFKKRFGMSPTAMRNLKKGNRD